MASLAEINIKFTADLRGFSTETQKALRIIGKVGDDMQKLGRSMSLYITAPLLLGGAAAIKFASDYNESLNKVDVAFGSASDKIKEFSKTSLDSFGIAEGSALDMAALFGDMATSMGLPVEKSAALSKSLVGLAGDLSSFKNIGIDEATTALNGIFTGETESLKRLGVVMTEANLQQFALTKGIRTQIKDMTQADKVTLRYAYVMEQTKNAQGDFARTGGGAANQMRIFQESLKQAGAEFGQVLIPAFTKGIKIVNEIIKGFSSLSDESKTTIVAVAGIAAATGPMLTIFGSLLTLIPNTISKFNQLKDNLTALKALVLANPFTAIAAVLATIAAITIISTSRFTELANATKSFAEIQQKASDSVASESAELQKNLAIAKNKSLTDELRQDAVKKINVLSPELLGNIRLENLYTQQTANSVKKYTDALLQKSKVQAAEEKLVDVQKKLLELQLGNTDAIKPSVWQNFSNALLSGGNSMTYAAKSALTVAENLGTENTELAKLQNILSAFIAKNKDVSKSNEEVAVTLQDIAKAAGVKFGTIIFFEGQIEDLQKLQKEVSTTNKSWQLYQDRIDVIQKKIDAIEGKGPINLPKPELPKLGDFEAPVSIQFSLEDLNNQKAYFEKLREQFSTTDQQYQDLTDNINNTEIKIKAIEGVENFDVAKNAVEDLVASQQRLAEIGEAVGESVAGAFANLSTSIVDSLGLAKTGFEGFIGGLVQTITKLVAMMLASAISQSIAGAAASGTATGPLAVFTTPAFIATAVGGVLAAFATIPKFEFGGIVGGSSFYGDKILARLNSGEMVLNNGQQRSLHNQLTNNGSQVIFIDGGFQLEGTTLKLLMNRVDRQSERTGL
ncbi:hypothetical protein [Flavobacterium sp.]|uniref:hypothetical protein n=1 Tax=Flavobacterium sp. TaxID=239 RepID=UPI0026049A33|nr:hypothetical protein [Flavobacterium sp.]